MIRSGLAALALAFALAHVPYLARSLEDIDSVNFALGVRDFDVANHRPHPPGYPVYIVLAKGAIAISTVVAKPSAIDQSRVEARAMSILSLLGAIAAIVLLYAVFSSLSPQDDQAAPPWSTFQPRALAATALAAACPLFWYLAIRPMSDMPGLAAALTSLACLALAWQRQRPGLHGERRLAPDRMAASGGMIVLGSLLAAIAMGFRSQTAMLTLPFLLVVLGDRIGRGVAGALAGAAVAITIGVALWAIPLVIATGGPAAYLAALGTQAAEDFAGVQMLYLTPTPRLAAIALLRTFIYPWDSIPLGAIVFALAAIGLVALAVRERRTLASIVALAAPYLAFHLLFQDMNFVRYALPTVLPMAFLAVCGLEFVLRRAALPVSGALALWSVAVASPIVAAYGSELSPTVRALDALREATGTSPDATLAMHQTFQRPLEAEVVPLERRIASPPRREWLELVRYWREGNTSPVWFLADPRRSDLALIDPVSRRDRRDFAWRFASLSDIGGMRPAAVAWYRMPAPGWFAEEGWALTPETAGIARLTNHGPYLEPITAWIRRRPEATRMLIGGRHLGSPSDAPVAFAAAVDARTVASWESAPGFFLHVFDLTAGELEGTGPLAKLTIQSSASPPVPTAIEQFDFQSAGRLMWGFAEGWHEAEYEPGFGVWRWASERSTLRLIDAHQPVTVRMTIESTRRYFDQPSIVTLKAAEKVLGQIRPSETITWEVAVPQDALEASGGRLVVETNQTYVPAERGRAADRRHLGLRVFGVDISISN